MAVDKLRIREYLDSARSVANPSRKALLKKVLKYAVAASLGILFMLPFAWTVSSSLKAPWEMFAFPPILVPENLQFQNYSKVFTEFSFALWYRNTLIIVVLHTLGVVLSCSLVAYGFARFDFRFKNMLFMMVLATLMLPAQVTLIPRFILFHNIGWLDTLLPLWAPAWVAGTPTAALGIFLMRQFLKTLPRDLDEAAILDGAGYFRIFWTILMPLCKPALATLAIITAISTWNEFLDAVVFLNSSENFTIAIGLWYFSAQPMDFQPLTHLLMAASVTAILPPIILFFAFQRYFVRGIALTGLKG